MTDEPGLSLDKITDTPWGDAFRREFELVVAANVFNSMQTGETLYNSVLDARLAYHCAPLDGGLKEEFLGVVAVGQPKDGTWGHVRAKIAETLADRPRGAWAVFEMDGKYDAYMADGHGGYGTESGHKFTYTGPDAPSLSFGNLYGAVLSWAEYKTRNRIKDEILAESFKAMDLQPGHAVKDAYMGGKQWSKIEFVKVLKGHYVGPSDAVQVRCTRRGVKPKDFVMEPHAFIRVFNVPLALPEKYADPDNESRLTTLPEQRQIAADEAFKDEVATNPPANLSHYGSAAPFRAKGDVYTRSLYAGTGDDFAKVGEFTVTFEPGSYVIADREMSLEGTSAPTMR